MSTQLEQLKKLSTIVADTGDIQAIEQYQPQDVTTNPSLILKASQLPIYEHYIVQSLQWAQSQSADCLVTQARDWLTVRISQHILERIPGKVSIELDAHFSFDTKASIDHAQRVVDLMQEQGGNTQRILIKIGRDMGRYSCCRIFGKKKGYVCNVTLIFSIETG